MTTSASVEQARDPIPDYAADDRLGDNDLAVVLSNGHSRLGAEVPRTILVDGFNVLHAVLLGSDRAHKWWKREYRERLLDRILLWRGLHSRAWPKGRQLDHDDDRKTIGDQIWVAFDGSRPATSVWAEPVAFAHSTDQGHGTVGPDGSPSPTIYTVFVESADDWIVRRARKADAPQSVIVVSADRKVTGRARGAGCEILTPSSFIRICDGVRESDR